MTCIMPQIQKKQSGGCSSKDPLERQASVILPDKKQRGLKGAREDQLAITEFDRLSEKRDQRGKVQDDHVPAKATPHTPTVPATGQLRRASTVAHAPLNAFCTC